MFNKNYLENKMVSTEITQMIQSAMKAAGVAKKSLFATSDETEKSVFQTEYDDCKKRIDVYKMIKTRYMEYETRDVEDILKKEIAKGISTGETVEEFRARLSKELHTITPEVDEEILQAMVKELRKDIKLFEGQNRTDLIDKAQDELKILAELLPAEPTEDDVLKFIHDNYPDGYTMKEMGKIIGSIKANPTFKNVDGAMCAKVVKANAL
jgi:uncharacterized protein YqeY